MTKRFQKISIETLRSLLSYNSDTGELTWRSRPRDTFNTTRAFAAWNNRWAGKTAFTAVDDGYFKGRILKQGFCAHRVIWAIYYGEWPIDELDHINGIRSDNRLENLRPVSRTENARNHARSKANTSGVTGVYWKSKKKRWAAVIGTNGEKLRLGTFILKGEAVAARKAAEITHNYHPNHGRSV